MLRSDSFERESVVEFSPVVRPEAYSDRTAWMATYMAGQLKVSNMICKGRGEHFSVDQTLEYLTFVATAPTSCNRVRLRLKLVEKRCKSQHSFTLVHVRCPLGATLLAQITH